MGWFRKHVNIRVNGLLLVWIFQGYSHARTTVVPLMHQDRSEAIRYDRGEVGANRKFANPDSHRQASILSPGAGMFIFHSVAACDRILSQYSEKPSMLSAALLLGTGPSGVSSKPMNADFST